MPKTRHCQYDQKGNVVGRSLGNGSQHSEEVYDAYGLRRARERGDAPGGPVGRVVVDIFGEAVDVGHHDFIRAAGRHRFCISKVAAHVVLNDGPPIKPDAW